MEPSGRGIGHGERLSLVPSEWKEGNAAGMPYPIRVTIMDILKGNIIGGAPSWHGGGR